MFKFKLASIESLKQNTETMRKRELGIALQEKAAMEQKYKDLYEIRTQLQGLMRPKPYEPLDLEKLKHYKQYDETIKKKQVQIKAELRRLEVVVNEKKEALQEAVKERKILENLRAIQYETYQEVCKKEEQQLVDELVAYKYSLKDKGE